MTKLIHPLTRVYFKQIPTQQTSSGIIMPVPLIYPDVAGLIPPTTKKPLVPPY